MSESILNPQAFSTTVQKFKPSGALRFTGEVTHRNYRSKIAIFDTQEFSRRLAGFTSDGAPSKGKDLLTKKQRYCTMGLCKVSKRMVAEEDLVARKPGTASEIDPDAVRMDEAADLAGIVDRTLEFCIAKILRTGQLSSTDLPDSENTFSIDFGIPAANTPTVGTSWSNTAADIVGDVTDAVEAIENNSGVPIRRIVVNRTVMNHITANTAIQSLLEASFKQNQLAEEGRVTRFLGLDWEIYNETYVDDSGEVQKFLTDNDALLLPDLNEKEIFEVQHGLNAVKDAAGQVTIVVGRTAYTYTSDDPVTETVVVLDRFLPCLKQPSAVGCIDVTA